MLWKQAGISRIRLFVYRAELSVRTHGSVCRRLIGNRGSGHCRSTDEACRRGITRIWRARCWSLSRPHQRRPTVVLCGKAGQWHHVVVTWQTTKSCGHRHRGRPQRWNLRQVRRLCRDRLVLDHAEWATCSVRSVRQASCGQHTLHQTHRAVFVLNLNQSHQQRRPVATRGSVRPVAHNAIAMTRVIEVCQQAHVGSDPYQKLVTGFHSRVPEFATDEACIPSNQVFSASSCSSISFSIGPSFPGHSSWSRTPAHCSSSEACRHGNRPPPEPPIIRSASAPDC